MARRGGLRDAPFDSYEDYAYSGSDEEFDLVDEESAAKASQFVTSKFQHFVQAYSSQLSSIEEALGTSSSPLWCVDRSALAVDVTPTEQATFLELAGTENKVLNKIVATLGALQSEAALLESEAATQVFAPLAMHGEALTGDEDADDGETQVAMGRLLPLLQSVCVFVRRAYDVVRNLVHQLASLYSPAQTFFVVRDIHLRPAFEAIGTVLRVLITLEEIIKQNARLKDGWVLYRRMVNNMRNDPETYDTDEDELRLLNRTLGDIDTTLFDDMVYQNCVEQVFDYEDIVNVTTNPTFKAEFGYTLNTWYQDVASRLGSPSETTERGQYVALCGLFGLYFTLYQETRLGSLFKSLWEAYTVVPLIHLYGNVVWVPTDFLALTVPELMGAVAKSGDVNAARGAYLSRLASELPSLAREFHEQVSGWQVRMESDLDARASLSALLNSRIQLFTQGIVLAYNIGHMYKTAMGLHTLLRKPLTPSRIMALCQMLELLKAIEHTYYRRSPLIADNLGAMVQQMTLALQASLAPIKSSLEQARRVDNTVLDALGGVNLALAMLDGPASEARRMLLHLGLAVANSKSVIPPDAARELSAQLRRLDMLCSLQRNLYLATETSFVYWSRVILPTYLKDAYTSPATVHKLPYMFAALQDAAALLAKVEDFNENVSLASFVDEPLARDVEVELRLASHSELLVVKKTPFEGTRDFAPYFALKPMVLFDRVYDVKDEVTHYLNVMFYDLTAVALQDWKVYEEMRNLAAAKWGLECTPSHLRGHNQQKMLDVLVIMRNIGAFVARYNYNLNNQFFIERSAASKALNAIDISHIAASIRTHGAGVMNTAVNYVFGFLKDQFTTFKHFLFDDTIRSRLMKDISFYKKNAEALGNVYPYERALQFHRDIRNLGTQGGLSYLDQFRILITHIGNAMGYIRMIRSGGLHATASEIKFVPDIVDMLAFQDMVVEDGLSAQSRDAARLLDSHLSSLAENFAEGSDYFKILVDLFSTEFAHPDLAFLANFFIIIPPLTINYVEYMRESKERLLKKNKDGAAFTDDGFAMGLAYILQVLGLTKAFDALHWFDAVSARVAEQEAKVADGAAARSKKRADVETARLTLDKLRVFKREFDLLYFTFSGALIFFRNTD
ncbi:WASH complex subunit 7 [Thecamonas trahens ATCC 50062]|uniref:WASH complex subunit 7 n=1 Tax=Thecamonas trahens ATCC 50062 TaxID=461836 RepID=A0A0L0DW28_THETB|nr:WASH complex subunit 7 [Thecamonas trahens ATCC 50062]KNC56420.1 WASH complex subunit 7 [Thecamonas trahens ATCC 50062]|eukprot:XP_013760932.1 WASH complex subunit 7 [Thecamonas trahens ATCC 50062]